MDSDGREMLVSLLSLWGHDTYEAEDGEKGLALWVEMRPDVALIDVGLPGIDGYELARRIRAAPESRQAFLVAFTGYGQPADQRQARDAGFDAHLVKPVDPGMLRTLLATRERRP